MFVLSCIVTQMRQSFKNYLLTYLLVPPYGTSFKMVAVKVRPMKREMCVILTC